MKVVALWLSLALFLVVLIAAFYTILVRRFPFVRKFEDSTQHAYLLLLISAAGLFAWSTFDLHLESVEIAGVKASVGKLEGKVSSLSDQMEVFFKSKRLEIFDSKNWNQVRTVKKTNEGFILEVTLKEEPIPGSVEVFEDVLPRPEELYKIDGRNLQFDSTTNLPQETLRIKYYPRVPTHN